jgi:hypothetical protein
MRKINQALIVRMGDFVATNDKYSRLIDRVSNTSKADVMLGVSLAIATKSYDLYLDQVSKDGYNPKDYSDVREDIKTISLELISIMSECLKVAYKDLVWKVEEAIRVLVVPYESSSVLFFNKIIDNDKIAKEGITLDSEIIYKRVISLFSYEEGELLYSEESKILSLIRD